jgi:uncharacterized protein DUF932
LYWPQWLNGKEFSMSLVLHCGSQAVSRETLAAVETPYPTQSHFPIPHIQIVEQAESVLGSLGIGVKESAFALSPTATRFFGLMTLDVPVPGGNYGILLGMRNSHDKEWAAALAGGSHVFVCDNLAFSGEFTLSRKHTRWIGRDLPALMGRAVDRVLASAKAETARLDRWQTSMISDQQADSIILRAAVAGVIPARETVQVRHEYHEPRHAEFSARSAWSLYNAFTERFKPRAESENGDVKRPSASVERVWQRAPRLIPLIESALDG